MVSLLWAVLCRARPLIRGTGTTGEARKTGAPLIVGGGTATEERGPAKNNASPRRTDTCMHIYTHTGTCTDETAGEDIQVHMKMHILIELKEDGKSN